MAEGGDGSAQDIHQPSKKTKSENVQETSVCKRQQHFESNGTSA
uniref:Zgc:161969 n=1 Tax=Nothobranchius kuhntae TaxID=321403 RepID=A0A1A8IM99_NOTKU